MSAMSEGAGDTAVQRIVSGGQTGVDRAALDVAIRLGMAHGGWCPRGRLAEDGTIPPRYQLTETGSIDYPVRTEQNVIDSDATLILCRGRLFGGTELTRRFAAKHARPLLVVDLQSGQDDGLVRRWLSEHSVRVLNVAGPRESSAAGIGDQAVQFLYRVFSRTPAD
jgi:hypothetical protein